MALDLYAGPLTRYYLGDWENIGERFAREHGLEYITVNPSAEEAHASEDVVTDPDVIRSAIYDWREVMTEGLAENLESPLEWDESRDAPHFTDRPQWEGYAGLQLLAALEENAEINPPDVLAEDWEQNPALQASRADDFTQTEYLHLLSAELWLPTPFPFTFRFMELTGNELCIGSAPTMLRELQLLNERTFKGDAEERKYWREDTPEFGEPFEIAARFGLAVFMDLAEQAIAHRLPLKLDY